MFLEVCYAILSTVPVADVFFRGQDLPSKCLPLALGLCLQPWRLLYGFTWSKVFLRGYCRDVNGYSGHLKSNPLGLQMDFGPIRFSGLRGPPQGCGYGLQPRIDMK